MNIKILVGIVAIVLIMILMGFVVLNEPGRLTAVASVKHGRNLEQGAHIYADNCASCHGVYGKAETCHDLSGEKIECQGFPLNNYLLFCEQRLEDLNYQGSLEQFIIETTAEGRNQTDIHALSWQFGGTISDKQIDDVAQYILNWKIDCPYQDIHFSFPLTVEDYFNLEFEEPFAYQTKPGNPELGGNLYFTYSCDACHGTLADESSAKVGPWLGDLAETGSSRIEGVSSAQYVYDSILHPNAFIPADCPNGPCLDPSLMPGDFPSRLSVNNPQDLADILAYLIGVENLPIPKRQHAPRHTIK